MIQFLGKENNSHHANFTLAWQCVGVCPDHLLPTRTDWLSHPGSRGTVHPKKVSSAGVSSLLCQQATVHLLQGAAIPPCGDSW